MKGDTSHDPEPVAGLNEFPGIPLEYVQVLRSRGIVQADRLLEATRTAEHLGRLAADTGIPAGRLHAKPVAGYEPSRVARPEERWVQIRAGITPPERPACAVH